MAKQSDSRFAMASQTSKAIILLFKSKDIIMTDDIVILDLIAIASQINKAIMSLLKSKDIIMTDDIICHTYVFEYNSLAWFRSHCKSIIMLFCHSKFDHSTFSFQNLINNTQNTRLLLD